MAITLYTGLPGNAKTLLAIAEVKALSEKEGRPVYYHGIEDVTHPWLKLDDPRKWYEVPPRAIVLIDEGQEIFRARTVSSMPPEFVTKLETHRHLGIDLFITTQHPSFLDPHVRRLTQVHKHLVRIRGAEKATVHMWRETRDNPDKNRKDSERVVWQFDKTLYGTYKSADAHTVKKAVSKRALFVLAAPIVLLGLCYLTYWIIVHYVIVSDKNKDTSKGSSSIASSIQSQQQLAKRDQVASTFDPVADAASYVAKSTPRVAGLPHTAPKYDTLTVPVRVPIPAACIQRGRLDSPNGVACKCYSQQGTPMPIEMSQCMEFAHNGFFQDFDADRDKPSQSPDRNRQAEPQMLAKAEPQGAGALYLPEIPYVSKLKGAPAK